MQWGNAECERREVTPDPENIRGVLGEALFLIRMYSMTAEEFTSGPVESGILTDKEVAGVYKGLFNEKAREGGVFPSQVRYVYKNLINYIFSIKIVQFSHTNLFV